MSSFYSSFGLRNMSKGPFENIRFNLSSSSILLGCIVKELYKSAVAITYAERLIQKKVSSDPSEDCGGNLVA